MSDACYALCKLLYDCMWVQSSSQCLSGGGDSLLLVLLPITTAIVLCCNLLACTYHCISKCNCCCDRAPCVVQLSIQFSQTFEGINGMLNPAAGPGLKMCTSMTMASFVYVLWMRSHAFQESSTLQHMYC